MFGEKEIVGQTILTLKKDKIILPDFTYAEPGEEIHIMLDPYQKKLMLMQREELLRMLYKYADKIEKARKEGRIGYTEYHNCQRYIWGILPLRERILNKKLEFQIFSQKKDEEPNMRQLRRLNLKNEIFAVGTGKQLHLYPSEESYKEELKLLKK